VSVLNLDPAKLLVIAVVAVILLGPDRLPQVARQVGGVWRSFNEYRHRMEEEVRRSIPDLPSTAEIARLARSPSALLNHLSAMSPDLEGGDARPPTSPAAVETADTEPVVDLDAPTAARRHTGPPPVRQPQSPVSDGRLPGDPGLN
jgi:Sec-independent protein translocase protein TatA